MTIIYVGNGIYQGLSSDTKPTSGIVTNAIFIETDTRKIYLWSSVNWKDVTNPVGKEGRVEGVWLTPTGHIAGSGYELYADGSSTIVSSSLTTGESRAYIKTGTTNPSRISYRTINSFTRRGGNPKLALKFQLNASTTNVRMFFGFGNTGNYLTGDTPLQDQSGYIFGVLPAEDNFQIIYNDTTDAQNLIDTGSAKNTGIHTIIIESNTTSGFRYSLDGSPFSSYIDTDAPGSSHSQSLQFTFENTAAEDKELFHYITYFEAER